VLALSLAATAGVTYAFHDTSRERDLSRFQNAVQATHDRIENRLDTHLAVLLATRGFFTTKKTVEAAEFRRFVDQLELATRYPGIQGIGFSRKLELAEVQRFEREMERAGESDFRVWPSWPARPRPEVHTIQFLEPRDHRNLFALGYDMYSEPVRREAMARARDTGKPAATGRVTLIQEIDERDKQAGFLIYVPIYSGAGEPSTVEERRERLVGFVYSAFRMEDLLAGIFGSEQEPRVSFTVHDGPLPLASELMHQSPRLGNGSRKKARFETSEVLPIGGRAWRLTFRSQPIFESGSGTRLVPYVGVLGLLVSGILFLVSRWQARVQSELRERARALEAMSEERNELLAREQAVRADAEAASRAKDEFLAMLGHELRNPLAPIVTGIELIKLRNDGGLDREHQVIERQVTHLVRLVDDLLDVSRITRGKIALKKQPVSLPQLVARAVEMASPVLEENRHHLKLDVPSSGELWVDGDETRLAQVIANLLSNAAKYTEPGGRIEVTARREGDEVALCVSDNGIGIPPDMLSRIFELFTQGKRGIDRSQGGLGLGLTLVRRLVEAHGGQVVAESDGVGCGSRFTVRLPALPARADEVQEEAGRRGSPELDRTARRILVVDDNKDAAELLADLLRGAGHEVTVAHDGPQALELAGPFRPEIAVLDIGLPVMDGYELGARLTEAGGPLRLFAVTGYGQEHDRARSRDAGFELHMVKPIDPAALLAAVDGRTPPPRAAETRSRMSRAG